MYLLFVIVFESIFVAFFQSTEGQVDLRGPPYLSPSQRHLCTCVYMELMFVYLNNEGGKERGREGEGGRETRVPVLVDQTPTVLSASPHR